MDSRKEDLHALRLALQMEKDGRKFYLKAQGKASHPLAKETFRALADWELEHMKAIDKFYSSLMEKGRWESVEKVLPKKGEAIDTFKTIFQKLRERIDQTVRADADDLEAYRSARDIEDKLAGFYQKKAEESSDNKAKHFYLFMADMEWEHYQILDNSLQLLENPAQWFEREEWTF